MNTSTCTSNGGICTSQTEVQFNSVCDRALDPRPLELRPLELRPLELRPLNLDPYQG